MRTDLDIGARNPVTEIKRQKKVDEQHDALLKQVKKLAWIGIGIATIALVLAIIALAR